MSRARKAREAVIPRDADFVRWRALVQKHGVNPKVDYDFYGRKLWGHAEETKRVYGCSADHTLHLRSFVRLRPLLEYQRVCNGGDGELPLLEICKDGKTLRFARDPSIPEDEEKRIQEEEAHGDIPGHTKFMYAYRSARLFDHRATQEDVFAGFLPQALNTIMYGGNACMVLYGEQGSGKTYTLLGRQAEQDYTAEQRPRPNAEDERVDGGVADENGNRTQMQSASDVVSVTAAAAAAAEHNSEWKDEHNGEEEEEEEYAEPEKDLVWLAGDHDVESGEDQRGCLQRTIHQIFERMRQGRRERQTKYTVELSVLLSVEGEDLKLHDLMSFDESGCPKECLVEWDPATEKFEALGAVYLPFRSPADMQYACLRANWMKDRFAAGAFRHRSSSVGSAGLSRSVQEESTVPGGGSGLDAAGGSRLTAATVTDQAVPNASVSTGGSALSSMLAAGVARARRQACTTIYRIRVRMEGVGDPSWKDILGAQLPEGRPAVGQLLFVETAGFRVREGYPDAHGNDGVFEENETLRIVAEVLEKVGYNNLPALRKPAAVPYRSNAVTRIMAPCLRQGAVLVFCGCAGIDKNAHVGSLHTLWTASCVQKPRSHNLRWKRVKAKLAAINLFTQHGASWAERSVAEKADRRQEVRAHVNAHVTANLGHILTDMHLQKRREHADLPSFAGGGLSKDGGMHGEWDAEHQANLLRAAPRLEKRLRRRSEHAAVSAPTRAPSSPKSRRASRETSPVSSLVLPPALAGPRPRSRETPVGRLARMDKRAGAGAGDSLPSGPIMSASSGIAQGVFVGQRTGILAMPSLTRAPPLAPKLPMNE